jgi:hypothetical protein
MSPADLTSALMCGMPIALTAGMVHGFDFLLTHRSSAPRSRSENCVAPRPRREAGRASALRVVVAKSPEQLAEAHELVRRRYARRGYALQAIEADGQPARSPQEITFLVASDHAPVGTLTLGLDGPSGLLAEGGYGDVIGQCRTAGHRMCELTRLAVAESADSRTVLAALFSLAHAVARTTDDVTRVVIEVNPRHVAFYCKMLGFAVAAGERFCERVRARSVLLALEVGTLEGRIKALEAVVLQPPLAKAA